MTSPTAGGRAEVACLHRLHTLAPEFRRPPHEGVEQMTRSSGCEQSASVLIDDRARVVVADVPHEAVGALKTPARALAAPI